MSCLDGCSVKRLQRKLFGLDTGRTRGVHMCSEHAHTLCVIRTPLPVYLERLPPRANSKTWTSFPLWAATSRRSKQRTAGEGGMRRGSLVHFVEVAAR